MLYKYIVSTPLTFPEYVTPHARDLLRRILVPDPRRRADLFEVARHSWLSEYSHVVGFIGSSTKSDRDVASSAMQQGEEPVLGRSASVREPTTRSPGSAAGPVQKPAPSTSDAESDPRSRTRDAKRRTVQLEYVAPQNTTTRGETSPPAAQTQTTPINAGRTRARGDAQGPVEVPQSTNRDTSASRDIPMSSQAMPPPVRPGRDQIRAASDSPAVFSSQQAPTSVSRPTTGGSLGTARLPSRGNSYSQPAVPTPTNTNAQGYVSQPKSSSGYVISGPMQSSEQTADGSRPGSQQNLAQYQTQPQQQQAQRGHKRSSTLGSIGDRLLGRSNSRRSSQQQEEPKVLEKRERKYPPVSMRNAMPNSNEEAQPRMSTESSRRTSFGFNRKNSDAPTESKRSSRRISFLPSSFSLSNFTGKKDQSYDQSYQQESRPESKGMAFGRGASRSPSRTTTDSTIPLYYEPERDTRRQQQRQSNAPPSRDGRYEKALPPQPGNQQGSYPTSPPIQRKQYRDDGYGGNLLDQTPERYFTPPSNNYDQNQPSSSSAGQYNPNTGGSYLQYQVPQSSSGYSGTRYDQSGGYGQSRDGYQSGGYGGGSEQEKQQIRPSGNRKFEYDHGNAGSSSATRRVMDFFRRRGKDRNEG